MLGSDGRGAEAHAEGRGGGWGAGESYGPGPEEQLMSQDHWLIRVGTSRRILFEEWEHLGWSDK